MIFQRLFKHLRNNRTAFYSLLTLVFIVLALYTWSHSQKNSTFKGFVTADLELDSACSIQKNTAHAFPVIERISTSNGKIDKECSIRFKALDEILELQISHYPIGNRVLRLAIEGVKGESLWQQDLANVNTVGWWRRRVLVPKGEQLRLRIIDQQVEGWVSVRTRLNFFHPSPLGSTHLPVTFKRVVTILFSLAGTFVLTFFLNRGCSLKLYLASVVLVFCMFYRSELFFYFDDWTILERISNLGFSGIFMRHNEHWPLIPSFITFVEHKLFLDKYVAYVFVSSALLVGNGCMCALFFRQLMRESSVRSTTSLVAGLFFIFSGLHAENIQWDVCKQMLCAVFFILAALVAGLSFVKKPSVAAILICCSSAFLACFSMATGFLVFVLVPIITCIFSSTFYERNREQRVVARALLLSFALLLPLGIAGYFYFGFGIEGGSQLGSMQKFLSTTPDQFAGFVFVGSLYGSIVRPIFGDILNLGFDLEYLLVLGGAINILGLMLSMQIGKTRKEGLGLWLIAQVFLYLPILLFAFGRAHMGVVMSLSLRYQGLPLIGFTLLFLPLMERLVYIVRNNALGFSRERLQRVELFVFSVCALYIYSQLRFVERFDYFTDRGRASREFVPQAIAWNELLNRKPFQFGPSFEGSGSQYEGLFPIYFEEYRRGARATFPIVHPDMMQRILVPNTE